MGILVLGDNVGNLVVGVSVGIAVVGEKVGMGVGSEDSVGDVEGIDEGWPVMEG